MSVKIIQNRLAEYSAATQRDELNAIKEIAQEIALCALARGGFFEQAAFQGGTCLRIVHGINRFSEDLDFVLHQPNAAFAWEPFLKDLEFEFSLYELEFKAIDRSRADRIIKAAFLKDYSFGQVLVLTHPRGPADKQTIQIKLEVDTNPPVGSVFETNYIDFPYSFSIVSQDLSSLFASKLHALLCRPYLKGRDWYDFVWYVSKKIVPNYIHLKYALEQVGPWQNQKIDVSGQWLVAALRTKIASIDWQAAKTDATQFLWNHDKYALDVWSSGFFEAKLKVLAENLLNFSH